jgi:hypothetical protein
MSGLHERRVDAPSLPPSYGVPEPFGSLCCGLLPQGLEPVVPADDREVLGVEARPADERPVDLGLRISSATLPGLTLPPYWTRRFSPSASP